MGVTRPWRLPRWTEVRELHQGRCGRTVLAWPPPAREGRGDAWESARADERREVLAVVRYVPARLLVHHPRATAFQGDVERLRGLRLPEAAVPHRFVRAPSFRAAYERSAAAVGGALIADAVEGTTLTRLLEHHGALSRQAASVVFRDVLRALVAVHERGSAHGDLRAGRIMVGADGKVTVTGLGLAALTTGDPALRAPELWRGTGIASAPADVYAATCLLHLCLTGQPPFAVPQVFSLMARHTTAPPPVAGVPIALREPLAAGLAKDPELRPRAEHLLRRMRRGTADQGRSELAALAEPLIEPLPHAPPAPSPPRWPIRLAGRGPVLASPSRRTTSYAEEPS
ncbi:protein kinase domain-containing protein [Streptomyces sp. NPDC003635]